MSVYTQKTTVRVLYGDTDAGKVVYNANYLRYFEMGRSELMREKICSYNEIEKMGFTLPVIEAWARYKAPAVYDDLLTIETNISEVSKLKCTFNYRIYRKEKDGEKQKLLAKGYTVHAAVDANGRLTGLPEDIIKKISSIAAK